jgi:Na+/proline symporter
LALPLAFVIVNFLWIPFFMRLGVTSIYEYLERRFGLAARMIGALLFVFILRLLWMATIVLTASRAVAQITHPSIGEVLPIELTLEQWTLTVLLSVGVLATVYTMLGGIKAVIWTDVAQFVVLFSGVVLTVTFIAWDTGTGPLDWWRTVTDDSDGGHALPPLYSWDITERNTILFTVLNVVFWYSRTFSWRRPARQPGQFPGRLCHHDLTGRLWNGPAYLLSRPGFPNGDHGGYQRSAEPAGG